METAVIGAGYVGLVQAAGLAHLGHRVRLADSNGSRVEQLRRGEVPIYEPGLSELLERGLEHELLSFHSDNREAAEGAEIVFLTLPTPTGDGGRADVSTVESVTRQLAPQLGPDALLVTKSTVPVGTAAHLRGIVEEEGSMAGVAANPEFLAEGNAVDDFLRAERIVVGVFEPEHGDRIARLYRGLNTQVLITDPASAELIKYGANAYLATRLTFANALAGLAEEMGADILDVMRGIGLDRRIGPHFFRPGPGWGGSCFPKDTRAMVAIAEDAGLPFRLVETVIDTNEAHQRRIARRCLELLEGTEQPTVSMWGVAFKAGTDDTRESPALVLARALTEAGARVIAFDPEATSDQVVMAPDPIAAADDADLLLVATEWPEFLRVDLARVAKAMRGDVVYDVRNLLDPEAVRAAGLRYIGLGRPNA